MFTALAHQALRKVFICQAGIPASRDSSTAPYELCFFLLALRNSQFFLLAEIARAKFESRCLRIPGPSRAETTAASRPVHVRHLRLKRLMATELTNRRSSVSSEMHEP